jgi:hypothetical protein
MEKYPISLGAYQILGIEEDDCAISTWHNDLVTLDSPRSVHFAILNAILAVATKNVDVPR